MNINQLSNYNQKHDLQGLKNTPCSHFESINEWLDFAEFHKDANYSAQENYSDSSSFTGNQNVPTFTKNLRANTPVNKSNFLKRLNGLQLDTDINADYQSQHEFSVDYDDTGFYCDTTAYMNGEEYCMMNVLESEQIKPIIWLACSIGGVHDVPNKRFENRGLAFTKAVESLQNKGYSVGIVAYSKCTGENHFQTIVVKQPDEQLNYTLLFNMLANCSALRTVGFIVRSIVTGTDCARTMGAVPSDFKSAQHIDETKLVCFGTSPQLDEFKDIKTAVDTILEHIKKVTD